MAVPDLLAALAEDWPRVMAAISGKHRTALLAAIAELSDQQGRKSGSREIVRLLLDALPPGDPLAESFEEPRFLAVARPETLTGVVARLRAKVDPPQSADKRILDSYWRSASDLRSDGIDPDAIDLIRLERPDGNHAVPMFQFDADGAPLPVVLRVNKVLGAIDDPWGAADWWLTGNVWLHDMPAALVTDAQTADLLAAATAAVAG